MSWGLIWGVKHWRIRADSAGLNVNSGWVANEDTRANALTVATPYRIRWSIWDIGDQGGEGRVYQLRWRVAGGTWAALAATGTVKWTLSSQYADGDVCSTQLLSTASHRDWSNKGVGVENDCYSNGIDPGSVANPIYEAEWAFAFDAAASSGIVYELSLWIGEKGEWKQIPGLTATLTAGAVASTPPTAGYTSTLAVNGLVSGTAPFSVPFLDTSTQNPESWAWDFGDGSTGSTTQHPLHTFEKPGTYTVTLTATNAAGSDSEIKTGYVVVSEPEIWDPPDPPADTAPEIVGQHISLGSKGYVVYPNTYEERGMPAFAPRFSSGEVTENDLSYWQVLTQEDFRGGEGEEIFDISAGPQTAYLSGYGIHTTGPAPTLRLAAKPTARTAAGNVAGDFLLVAWNGTPVLIHGDAATATIRVWDENNETWGNAITLLGTNYLLATHGYPTCAVYAPPWIVLGTSKGYIVHIAASIMTGTAAAAPIHTSDETGPVTRILPFSGLLYYVGFKGSEAKPWTRVYVLRWPKDADKSPSWKCLGLTKTSAAGSEGSSGLPLGNDLQMLWHQGALWFTVNTGSVTRAEDSTCVLAWSNGVDILGYRTFPGFQCCGMASIGGRLLMVGNYLNQAVVQNDEGVILQRKEIPTTWVAGSSRFHSLFVHHDHLLVGGSGTARLWEMDGGFGLSEAVFLPTDSYDENLRVMQVVFAKGRYHLILVDQRNVGTLHDCETTDQVSTSGQIILSTIDAGLRSVRKYFAGVLIRTKDALSVTNVVEVRADDTLLGFASAGTRNELLFPNGFGTKEVISLTVKLASGASGTPPEITSISLRYVPLGLAKRVWSFAVKAENSIRLADNTFDPRNGAEISQDLWSLYLAQMPVAFRDLRGNTYTVIISDIADKQPLPKKSAPYGTGVESQVIVELMEY